MELIIASSLILAFVAILLINRRKVALEKRQQQLGVTFLGQIKSLITLIQEHRGLSTAWLRGDTDLKPKLTVLKERISKETNLLKRTAMCNTERLDSFADHWQRLIDTELNSSTTNNFEQHSAMIQNLAYLLEDTAENYHLTANYLTELSNVGYIWRELPLAIESLGQSRAIGTGVSTQHNCSSVDKIRLEFLITRMSSLCSNTLRNLSCIDEEKRTHVELTQKATRDTEQLIHMIKSELLNSDSITIDNTVYFAAASKAMARMNAVFDHQIKQVSMLI